MCATPSHALCDSSGSSTPATRIVASANNAIVIQDTALAIIKLGVAATGPDHIYRDGAESVCLRDTLPNNPMYAVSCF